MAYTTINKSSEHFNTITYSGNGSNPRTLTGVGFQPDWVWQKNRTDGNGHTLADAVRGANKTLSSDGNGAEVTDKSDGHLDAFTSDGFTVGAGSSSDARVNDGSHTYVAWNWKANGAGSSNSDGSVTSTVSANTTAGFSIVTWTSTGSAHTIGHGLGSTPAMIIMKGRHETNNWMVYHHKNTSAPETDYLTLDDTAPTGDHPVWNDTAPTSSVFSLGTWSGNDASGTMVAYCFAEKTGYSKFGSYVGNGNADGVFVYLGFKPSFVMTKCTSASGQSWHMQDNKRDGFNYDNKRLFAESSSSESGTTRMDLLSNGFKYRDGDGQGNGSTYIYMAFGQSLVGSNGVTAKAR